MLEQPAIRSSTVPASSAPREADPNCKVSGMLPHVASSPLAGYSAYQDSSKLTLSPGFQINPNLIEFHSHVAEIIWHEIHMPKNKIPVWCGSEKEFQNYQKWGSSFEYYSTSSEK